MTTIITAWQGVKQRIETAATQAGRPANSVSLLAVSKTFPADDVRALYEAGQRTFGENYAQELEDKALALADCPELQWHFIGPLQSNKTALVARHAHWVHSIERVKIAQRLSAQRAEHLPPLQVCIQVNVSGEASKSGVAPADCLQLAHELISLPRIRLRGLMCLPEASDHAELLAAQFKILRDLQAQMHAAGLPCDILSMGMSADLEAAVAAGSTLVRVGSAIFGARSAKD